MLEGSTRHFKTPEGIVQLVRLTSHLSDLVEMSMHYSRPVSADDIIRFIKNHEKLVRVKFSISPDQTFDRFDVAFLRERLEHEWHIRVFHDEQSCWLFPQLTFERKNATLSG